MQSTKKLLILGSNVGVDEIIRLARLHNVYTIVADWYDDEKSTAKKLADESLPISTADTEALRAYIEAHQVNGVLAGVSEFNLKRAIELSSLCDLPFYCSQDQWDAIEEKDSFRALCAAHNVPCPQTYFVGALKDLDESALTFPLVVKPVDGSASRGVSICMDSAEFQQAAEQAMEASEVKKLIVEQFVQGNEFTAHYVISNGKAALSCLDDRIPIAVHEGNVTTIPAIRVYPGLCLDSYLRQVNQPIISLCESLGLEHAIVFVQGLYDPEADHFAIFEAGLRSAGEVPYRFTQRVTGQSHFQLLLSAALNEDLGYNLAKEDPRMGGRVYAIYSLVGRHGNIASILGADCLTEKLPCLFNVEQRYHVGDAIPDTDTLRQIVLRFCLECSSKEELAYAIETINNTVEVRDAQGESLIVPFRGNL